MEGTSDKPVSETYQTASGRKVKRNDFKKMNEGETPEQQLCETKLDKKSMKSVKTTQSHRSRS